VPNVDPGPRTSDSVIAFGLTGGIASGKSIVARYFESLGAKIIDADRIGHEVIERGRPAYQEIIGHFGNEILDSSGQIDRKRLGSIVFADPHQLRALNAIVHPRIIAREGELARGFRDQNPRAVVIVDAALIFESGIGGNLRKVIVAWCRPEQQLERLMPRRRFHGRKQSVAFCRRCRWKRSAAVPTTPSIAPAVWKKRAARPMRSILNCAELRKDSSAARKNQAVIH